MKTITMKIDQIHGDANLASPPETEVWIHASNEETSESVSFALPLSELEGRKSGDAVVVTVTFG